MEVEFEDKSLSRERGVGDDAQILRGYITAAAPQGDLITQGNGGTSPTGEFTAACVPPLRGTYTIVADAGNGTPLAYYYFAAN